MGGKTMKDLRCMVGRHAYPRPGKDHPVKASDVTGGLLTLVCARCQGTKAIKWRMGPPPRDVDPPIGGSFI
jgi:hypothetical protein